MKFSSRLFWGILWALFPYTLLMPFLYYTIKPGIVGKVPEGEKYAYWLIGLIAMGSVLFVPLFTLVPKNSSELILMIDICTSLIGIFLIFQTFRNSDKNIYLPLNKFRLNLKLLFFFAASCLPMLAIFITGIYEDSAVNTSEIIHPLMIAFESCVKTNSLAGILIGFLSVGLLGPIFEELVFRGLLLGPSQKRMTYDINKLALDSFSCLYFAVIHIPTSFLSPLIFAVIVTYVRRKTNSLYPPIVMHCLWNSSILTVMLLSLHQ